MDEIKKYHSIVESAIKELILPNRPYELYNPIEYFLRIGGKRLRPILVLATAEMFQKNIESSISAAIGLEIFHNSTLLHDDLMDNSIMRRGKPTVHEKWSDNTAILSGDAMITIATQCIMNVEDSILRSVLNTFNEMADHVYQGQRFDMDYEMVNSITESEYISMITLKTAKLIATSLKIGAIICSSNDETVEQLYNFGINIGIAYQIQDDLLDTYGDSRKTGKKIGNDILSGKKTYLFTKAYELSTSDDRKILLNIVKSFEISDQQKISVVTSIYQKYSINQITEKVIAKYYDKAIEHFNCIAIPQKQKEIFLGLIKILIKRDY